MFGKAAAGAEVSIQNTETGATRQITADANGRFTAAQLQPGHYKVTAAGQSQEVEVVVGTGTSVNFAPAAEGTASLERIEVVGNRVNPIDVSSVESTTVFSQKQIQALPVARNVTDVALLAPGTVQGDSFGGTLNLASFGGSSVAENGYYINGFDVTNIRNFLSYADLPFDAIGSQQIKTGGYGAEYGRSLGGVINLVTKRGTNTWTGGVSAYFEPQGLSESGKNVRTRNAELAANGQVYEVFRSANENSSIKYDAYAGGALVKDHLFFFGMVEGQSDKSDVYGYDQSQHTSDTSPKGLVKLDWNISDNHSLEFTGIHNRTTTHIDSYFNAQPYSTSHDDKFDDAKYLNGGDVYIGKYTGHFTDTFDLSVMGGWLKNYNNWRTEAPPGTDCPAAYDSRTGGLDYIGFWNPAAFTIQDRSFGPETDTRKALRIDADWQLGDHALRFGYDHEKFTSTHDGLSYSGGIYYRYFSDTLVRVRHYQTASGSYTVENSALYAEDSWRINDRWLAYLGLRSESFDNKNDAGESFVKADNLIAPRLGFAWDVNGDSTFKVYGNAGRYYIPVASNTNIRASGFEALTTEFYNYSGIDPVTGAPITLGTRTSGPFINGSLTAPDPRTVADTNLKPMYQDEFILGAQWLMGGDWTFGVKAIHRQVKNGMDDYCSHAAFANWAADNGYTNFDPSTMATCIIVNPGKDVNVALDLENDGNYSVVTVPNSYLQLPKYQRKYNALEFTAERPKQDGWYMQGSYTYAKSTGNVEGYVNSSLEQEDAGLTQDFDNRYFEDGANGSLPNDRRHTLKLFGTYDIGDQVTLSGNFLLQSGRPVNCQGYVPLEQLDPLDAQDLEAYSASSFYCLTKTGTFEDTVDGVRQLTPRGSFGRTPWIHRFDLGVSYRPHWANDQLELRMDVFNVFNSQKVTERNEAGELVRQTDDNDIDGDGNTSEFYYRVNPDFLNDVNYQAPRYVRFTARFKW
ncbi:MAG TPA: TonB-dependent receptor [Xanthomonadaceae bacterium]|nr:TonB-dependent receptor [Xanthomonadaceae bacterium]